MSTTLDVYPCTKQVPTFQEVIDLSNIKINEYLNSININVKIKLKVKIQSIKSDEILLLDSNEKVMWEEENYAWFYIDGIPGGIDCYFCLISNFDKEYWIEDIKIQSEYKKMEDNIMKSMEIGYYWKFRKSAGQSGIATLVYGIIAASLAKLTDGFIYSDDGAWEFTKFPAYADDFFEWYLKANMTTNDRYKTFTENAIRLIYEELKYRVTTKI